MKSYTISTSNYINCNFPFSAHIYPAPQIELRLIKQNYHCYTIFYLRILLPFPTWYMPQEKRPRVVKKIAMALGPELGILRANRTGAKPPGGGPSCRTGMSLMLAIPALFLITASVIFFLLRFPPFRNFAVVLLQF